MKHLEIGKIEDRERKGVHATPANSDMVNDEGERTRTNICGSHSDVMLVLMSCALIQRHPSQQDLLWAPVSCEKCMSHFLVLRHAIESPISITSTAD